MKWRPCDTRILFLHVYSCAFKLQEVREWKSEVAAMRHQMIVLRGDMKRLTSETIPDRFSQFLGLEHRMKHTEAKVNTETAAVRAELGDVREALQRQDLRSRMVKVEKVRYVNISYSYINTSC